MDRLKALEIFLHVVDCLNFSRAAEHLQLPRSTISAVIAQLERDLNVRLFQRTTRSISLTTDGQLLAERSRPLLHDLDELENLFRQANTAISGRLKIDVPNRMAARLIIPALPDFLALHPQLELMIGATDRAVDLIQEGIDCVIRVGQNEQQNLIARPLGELSMVNCASPAYLQQHGIPQTLADLSQHQFIRFAQQHGEAQWDYQQQGKNLSLAFAAQVTVNQADSYLACALAGLGIIQIPRYDVQDLLDKGQLQAILPDYRPAAMPVVALYPDRRHLTRRLRVFLEWVSGLFIALTAQEAARNDAT